MQQKTRLHLIRMIPGVLAARIMLVLSDLPEVAQHDERPKLALDVANQRFMLVTTMGVENQKTIDLLARQAAHDIPQNRRGRARGDADGCDLVELLLVVAEWDRRQNNRLGAALVRDLGRSFGDF